MSLLFLLTALLFAGIGTLPVRAESNVLLQRDFGGAGYDVAYSTVVDSAGNVYLAGTTNSFGYSNYRALLLKYNSTGSLQWAKTWGGTNGTDVAFSLALDSSGMIYVTGYTSSFGSGSDDLFLLKFTPNGVPVWQKTWGGSLSDFGLGVTTDASGRVYVVGGTHSTGAGNGDLAVLKFNTDGSLVWERTWGGSEYDYGYDVAADSSGVIYVSGSTPSIGAGAYDAVLLKFNASDGGSIFQKTWGGTNYDYGQGLAIHSPSGSVYMTGVTLSSGAGGADALMLKIFSDGTLAWGRTWGGSDYDSGRGIAVSPAGEAYVAGDSYNPVSSSLHMFLVRLTSAGGLSLQTTLGGGSNNRTGSVALDSSGNAYVSGGIVQAPPYFLGQRNSSLGAPAFALTDFYLDILEPTFVLGTPSGIIDSPSGSQAYVASSDAFLFKYGTVPTVTCGGGQTCSVLSNATIVSTSYDPPTNTIHVFLSGDHGSGAWVNVSVPKSTVEDQDPSNIHVTVEGVPLSSSDVTITSDSAHFFIYFEFTFNSPDQADVSLGTIVIAIPPYLALVTALLLIPILVAAKFRRPLAHR